MAGRSGVAGTSSVGKAGIGHQETALKEPSAATEERLSDLLEPSIVLRAQFFALAPGNRRWGGEQFLMAAVLEDAIAIYLNPTLSGTSQAGHVLREARRWLHSEDRSGYFPSSVSARPWTSTPTLSVEAFGAASGRHRFRRATPTALARLSRPRTQDVPLLRGAMWP
jgi:hypothetical protein